MALKVAIILANEQLLLAFYEILAGRFQANMEYLVRFVQMHESFRKAELEASADLYGINMEFLNYSQYVRYYLCLYSLSPILPSCHGLILVMPRADLRLVSPLYHQLAR